ncbi:hypothetical protein JKP88DRAFT_240906 [Tribonema minus]|uniref:Uncharacterized protein n=1 Tax=Tribonema minus TaxID=303371 RepID=A0A835ZC83_9STRA|nr:hypothetical protein JKP88DRAFT_240906 [Tribonema minus]
MGAHRANAPVGKCARDHCALVAVKILSVGNPANSTALGSTGACVDDHAANVGLVIALGVAGACEEVVVPMRARAEVITQALMVVMNLSLDDDDTIALGVAGACEEVVATMGAHTADVDVITQALGAVFNLSIGNPTKGAQSGQAREEECPMQQQP